MNKILHVVPSLSKTSGVTNFVMNLYNSIDRSKYHFDLLYIFDAPSSLKVEFERLGATTIYIPKPTITNIYKFYKELDNYLKRHKGEYSAIHLHEVLVGPIILPLAKKHGIKTRIIHSHNSKPSENPLKAIRNNLLCLPLKSLSNVWLACSDKAGEFLYGKKNLPNVRIVNNGIDINKYQYNEAIRKVMRKEFNIDNDTLVIGHVGRFSDQKNHKHLISTIESLRTNMSNFEVLLIGNGPLEEDIKLLVKNKGLDPFVKFLGVRTDINHLLQAIDIFVLPSLFEGLPIAGIEAQAAGLPCIFSDEITKEADVTGLVTFLSLNEPYDKWASMIQEVYKNTIRRDTVKDMRNAGFDIVDLVKSMEKIYN